VDDMKHNIFHSAFIIILFLTLTSTSLAQNETINSSFRVVEGIILIEYEIENGDPNSDYEVSIVLLRSSDNTFKYVPEVLEGDIGEGKFAGKMNTIKWLYTSAEEELLSEGEDYYFEVKAEKITGGSTWYYYAGGAVVAGLAAFLLSSSGGNGNGTTNGGGTTETIADPPGRP
jgi:hypothetical protein